MPGGINGLPKKGHEVSEALRGLSEAVTTTMWEGFAQRSTRYRLLKAGLQVKTSDAPNNTLLRDGYVQMAKVAESKVLEDYDFPSSAKELLNPDGSRNLDNIHELRMALSVVSFASKADGTPDVRDLRQPNIGLSTSSSGRVVFTQADGGYKETSYDRDKLTCALLAHLPDGDEGKYSIVLYPHTNASGKLESVTPLVMSKARHEYLYEALTGKKYSK